MYVDDSPCVRVRECDRDVFGGFGDFVRPSRHRPCVAETLAAPFVASVRRPLEGPTEHVAVPCSSPSTLEYEAAQPRSIDASHC